jgi:MFS family permease
VLSSYFYGYLLTQVVSGWLSLKFGGKKVLAFSMLMGSILTILVPVSARTSYILLIICRFFNGLFHVCTFLIYCFAQLKLLFQI